MKQWFEMVYVRHWVESVPEVRAFLKTYSGVSVVFFYDLVEVSVPGTSMEEKIANGKRILVIDKRSGSLLDWFENHDPGSRCPAFPKLVPGTGCRYNCYYCFLQATYRAVRPFVSVYVVDLPKLERDIRRMFPAHRGPVVISAGEMSDPLGGDYLGQMPRVVELFGSFDHVKLLLLTKSGIDEIQPLLSAHHNGHTITSWSLTCEEVVTRYEPGNESIANRLAAARAAQDAGYEVRFRLDPMLLIDGWQGAFAHTIQQVYELGIRPSRFTLGSFRLLGSLRGIIRARFPESDLLDQPLVNEAGKRWRYPHEVREAFYRHAITKIREHSGEVAISICKETPEMHQTLDGLVNAAKCNCLP